MFTKRFVCAATIVVASLGAACGGEEGSTGASPTSPSATGAQESASSLTAAESTELAAACSLFTDGGYVTTPGAAPPGGTPGTVVGPGELGPVGPDGTVTTPGGGPTNPSPGTHLAIGGSLENVAGSCPTLTFTIGRKTVRTTATTAFGSGSCASFRASDRVGAMGAAQADGSVVASCVGGL